MNPFEITKRIGVRQPLDKDVIDRAVTGDVSTSIRGADPQDRVFFGPSQPLTPYAQDTAYGRQFDYPWGVNLAFTPRAQEPISFSQLRALADSYDLLRLLIETRKDQLVKFDWAIIPKDETKKPDKRCQEFGDFLQMPDRRHNWQTWLRALVEEMLVTDAACVQPVLTRGGDLFSLDWFDGATLHLLVDPTGRTPLAPDVAYQQILKGVPAVDYSADDLIYIPRNRRINRLYGYSPVEQIIMTVNIALRRQINQLQYFTEGNIPEALATVPKEWNPEQIKKYQEMWDIMYTGNTAQRRRMKFIPFGTKYYPTKEEILKDVFDEWLARVCCYAFSLPAAPFIRDQNRATAESAKEAALEEGLHPLMSWVRDLINIILWKYKGWFDLQFKWQDEEPTNPTELATMNTTYVKNGIISVDEARQALGMEGIGMPPAVFTGTGVILIRDIINPPDVIPPDSPQMQPGGLSPPQQGNPNASNKPPPQGTPPAKQDEKQRKKPTEGEPIGEANKLLNLHVHLPKQDVLVETGPTTINVPSANAPMQKSNGAWPTKRRIIAKRNEDGKLEATFAEDTLPVHIVAKRNDDGELEAAFVSDEETTSEKD